MRVSLARALAWGCGAAFATWLTLSAAQATGETVSSWFKQSDPNPVLVQGSDGTNAVAMKVDSSGSQSVGGPAADDAAASGNPVPIGCKYNSTLNTVEDGDVSYVGCDARTNMRVLMTGLSSSATDSVSPSSVAAITNSTGTGGLLLWTTGGMLFDGSGLNLGRSAVNATDSTGTGIAAAGILAQLDDTSMGTVTENRFGNLRMSANRGLVESPYATPEESWQYAAATTGIVNTTTAVTFKAAAGAGLRNYITSVDIMSEALGAATEVAIRDGAAGTVIWRTKIGTTGLTSGRTIVFPRPIRGTANTLLEVVTLTASVTGAVYFNAAGYVAP